MKRNTSNFGRRGLSGRKRWPSAEDLFAERNPTPEITELAALRLTEWTRRPPDSARAYSAAFVEFIESEFGSDPHFWITTDDLITQIPGARRVDFAVDEDEPWWEYGVVRGG